MQLTVEIEIGIEDEVEDEVDDQDARAADRPRRRVAERSDAPAVGDSHRKLPGPGRPHLGDRTLVPTSAP
jgi:hypothetical protein